MGIKLGGASNLFKGGSNKVPDFKPSTPKPDVKPQFSPRPDINGNKPGAKPDVKPQFSPRPDINGNLPSQNRPGFSPDSLKPSGLGNRLGGAVDAFGGVAQGVAGLAGAGLDIASTAAMMAPQMMGPMGPMGMAQQMMPPQLMGPQMMPPMMDPMAQQLMGPQMMAPQMMPPMMDPYAGGLPPELGGAQMMDPYAGGLPPELGGAQMMDPFSSGGMPAELANPAPRGAPMGFDTMQQGKPAEQAKPAQEAKPAEPQAPLAEDGTPIPQATDKRPEGDKRSAKDIVNDTPALAKLGRQKDIKFDELCKQTGVDPKLDLKDAKQNPDAVYRLAKVLEFIDSSKISDGGERTGKVQGGKGDGNIEGITKDGDARHGTEAGMVKDFAEKGYASLGSDHRLPTTSDTHVKKDGGNKDNFQWFAGEAGKHLWFMPGVSNVLTGIGNSEGGAGGAILGGLGGVVQTWKGAAEGLIGAVGTGKINPASALLGAYTGALGQTEAAPQEVKDLVNMLPF
ncbi:hypothetical protein [Archangium primigenium]|uniref:hypothetical protein n=1 Tax=[Archangium] primigenium TaxID=2792470 RepID=UPI001EF95958|nr:hypothetical protein [Archangium primigenium]